LFIFYEFVAVSKCKKDHDIRLALDYYLLKKIRGSKLTIKQKQRHYSFNAGFYNFGFGLSSLTIIYFNPKFERGDKIVLKKR